MYIFQLERYLLERQVRTFAPRISGKILDVGAGKTTRYKHLFTFSEYLTLDIEKHENADIIGSADRIPLPDASVDAILCTQVLGDLTSPDAAIREFARVLRPGGYALVTESFMNELHDEPRDYWRFTSFGLQHLFAHNDFTVVALDQRGGFFTVIAHKCMRYLIDRFGLYRRPFIGRVMSALFRMCGAVALFADRIDRSEANRKHALGWCVLARRQGRVTGKK